MIQLLLLLLCALCPPGYAQEVAAAQKPAAEVKELYDAGRWSEVVLAVPESLELAADLEFYRAMSLAQLQRWDEAEKAFEAGRSRFPRDSRFAVELAGLAYRRKDYAKAKRELRSGLAIAPGDDYSNDFLGSIYFQEDNLEAALKYWNRAGKPKLDDLSFDPQPKLRALILDRAFAFSAGQVWTREQYLKTRAQLDALELFPRPKFELVAKPDSSFDLDIHAGERNGWGFSSWDARLSFLRGLPYQTVYPESYNLGRRGMNWLSLARWDDEKRRVYSELAAPLRDDPRLRWRVYFDWRNENWDLTNTIAPGSAAAAGLNMEKAAAGAGIRIIPSGEWEWSAEVEYSYRKFRDVNGIPAAAANFFTDGSAVEIRSEVRRALFRLPERRFTVESGASAELGTFFQEPLGRYGSVQGFAKSTWLPKARGDDYQTVTAVSAGRTIGDVPFDHLFMLGFERDNALLLRGHPGLRNGEKGNAPLGRNYVLVNAETDKIIHKDGIFTVKLGPFLDTGKIYDPSGLFGSPKWLFDTGAQMKLRVLGSFEFVLGYGKDLRSGNNSFFTGVTR